VLSRCERRDLNAIATRVRRGREPAIHDERDGSTDKVVTPRTYNRIGRLKPSTTAVPKPAPARRRRHAGGHVRQRRGRAPHLDGRRTGTSTYAYDSAGRLASHTNAPDATRFAPTVISGH
jgi:YD repeat-containing protein